MTRTSGIGVGVGVGVCSAVGVPVGVVVEHPGRRQFVVVRALRDRVVDDPGFDHVVELDGFAPVARDLPVRVDYEHDGHDPLVGSKGGPVV